MSVWCKKECIHENGRYEVQESLLYRNPSYAYEFSHEIMQGYMCMNCCLRSRIVAKKIFKIGNCEIQDMPEERKNW